MAFKKLGNLTMTSYAVMKNNLFSAQSPLSKINEFVALFCQTAYAL